MAETREELELRINTAGTTIEVKRAEAEALRLMFISSMASRIQDWLPQIVEKHVTAEYEVTKSLGGRLTTLKVEMGELRDRIPAKILDWFGGERMWPHRDGYGDFNATDLAIWRDPSRGVDLHAILKKTLNKYIVTRLQSYQYQIKEIESMSWHEEQIGLFSKYVNALEVYLRACQALTNAKAALDRYEAATLWNKA